MNYSTQRLARFALAIGWTAGGVLLILLLTRSNPNDLAVRAGVAALGAIVFAFTANAGARLVSERPEPLPALLGCLTAIVSGLGFLTVGILAFSTDKAESVQLELFFLFSLALGAISLLVVSERGEDAPAVRLARGVAVFALLALTTLAVLDIAGVQIDLRGVGVAAAVFLIAVLSLPLLRLAAD